MSTPNDQWSEMMWCMTTNSTWSSSTRRYSTTGSAAAGQIERSRDDPLHLGHDERQSLVGSIAVAVDDGEPHGCGAGDSLHGRRVDDEGGAQRLVPFDKPVERPMQRVEAQRTR